MLGSPVPEVLVTARGCRGDRAWALRDLASGRIASAKRFPRLLAFRARYAVEPTPGSRGRTIIDTPDGRSLSADDPAVSATISEILGHEVRLESHPRADEKTGIDRRTVFGDVPVSQMKPDWTPATMPDYFQLKSGSFFEIGTVFVLTSGSAAHLGRLQGAPGPADRRRFRPNLYLDTGPGSERFVEDEWAGRALRVGDDLVLADFAPTLWCVTSTLA
ncbi:MAG: MOSC N-terminal beta barrel domain-containing protein, partial [Solirubrobacteraceae bacterium]